MLACRRLGFDSVFIPLFCLGQVVKPLFCSLSGLRLLCCLTIGPAATCCDGRELDTVPQSRSQQRTVSTKIVGHTEEALARLNWSPVPTPPALPTASLLGLLSPRLSSGVTSHQFGGLQTHDGRLAGLGMLSPRLAPALVLVRFPPVSLRERMLYAVAVLSPRAAVAIEMLREGRRRATRHRRR